MFFILEQEILGAYCSLENKGPTGLQPFVVVADKADFFEALAIIPALRFFICLPAVSRHRSDSVIPYCTRQDALKKGAGQTMSTIGC